MDKFSPTDSDFNEFRKRIVEIKRKNKIICKKLGISALSKTSIEDVKDTYTKQKHALFDEMEISAVENCYKKALRMAEYYLNLRKIKKQQKLDSKRKQNNVPVIIPEVNSSMKDSVIRKGVAINFNDKENCKTNEDGDLFSLCGKRKKQKSQSSLSVFESHSEKSNDKSKSPIFLNKYVESSQNASEFLPSKQINYTTDNLHEDVVCISDSFPISEKLSLITESFSSNNSTPIQSSSSTAIRKRDNANSDVDIAYPESVNCSTHKKRNIPVRKPRETKVNNTRKLAYPNHSVINLENSSKKHDFGKNNIHIACNQDINEGLEENIFSVQSITISNGNGTLTRNFNLKNPSSNSTKSSVTAKSYKNKGQLNVENTKFDHNKKRNIKRTTEVQVLPEIDLTEESKGMVDKSDIKEKTGGMITTQFDSVIESDEIIPETDISGEFSRAIDINLTEDLDEMILSEIDSCKESREAINIDKTKKAGEVPQFDLVKDSCEMIPEIDLLSEAGEAINIDRTENFDEVILPELDLTEEPVDFTVPRLHLTESIYLSQDIEESLKSQGVVIRNGRWSKEEENLLKRNFRDFQSQFGMHDVKLLLGVGTKAPPHKYDFQNLRKFLRVKHFYVRLGKDINERKLKSIYLKAREMFSPLKKYNDCTSSDVAAVIRLQKKYGSNWSLIGQKLKINNKECYKIYARNKKPCFKGKWSKSEVKLLISAIKSVENVSDLSTLSLKRISWDKVAELVPTRNSDQCSQEWKNNLSKIYKPISYQKWNKSHSARLINLLKNKFKYFKEYLINWTEVYRYFKNVVHSETALKKKWFSIKYKLPDEYKVNFSSALDFCFKRYNRYIMEINQSNF